MFGFLTWWIKNSLRRKAKPIEQKQLYKVFLGETENMIIPSLP